MTEKFHLRVARQDELGTINAVIEAAVMNWHLPERIKRLALPSYRYTNVDFEHFEIIVAEMDEKGLVGVAAFEVSDSEIPGQQALLLHGLYVKPEEQHQGIGSRLLSAVEALVSQFECNGLVVKAHADAVRFFESHGMQRLESIDSKSVYAHRFWKPVEMIIRPRS
ncbi:GNAT family N-acetyltransferase [Kaarinaea lacus]